VPIVEIVSFRSKALRRLFEADETRGLPQDRVRKPKQILVAIACAEALEELDSLPGCRLHQLTGARSETWSISVSGNWRLTFRVEDGQVQDVDLEDYH
jgi:proteic killer suppression protein